MTEPEEEIDGGLPLRQRPLSLPNFPSVSSYLPGGDPKTSLQLEVWVGRHSSQGLVVPLPPLVEEDAIELVELGGCAVCFQYFLYRIVRESLCSLTLLFSSLLVKPYPLTEATLPAAHGGTDQRY